MKLRHTLWMLLAIVFGWPLAALSQLQLVPDVQPQRVFAGVAQKVIVVWHNAGDKTMAAEIRVRILQTSSATMVESSERSWKKLQVLPGQTVIESALLDFPTVKAETKFLLQWLENSNSVIGRTDVLVYPTNLLVELKPLAGDEALGIFDPLNQLKPLLKNLKLPFTDLENVDLENFSGRLAIVGSFESKVQMREGLAKQIQTLAKKGAAIVWLQPPPEMHAKLQPSFYSVYMNTNAVLVVQPELVADLPDNPQSQLNLVYFCKLALQPEIFHLPN